MSSIAKPVRKTKDKAKRLVREYVGSPGIARLTSCYPSKDGEHHNREGLPTACVDTPCCYGLRVNHWEAPTIVDIPVIRADRGAVGVVEKDVPFPFDLKRVYYLFDVPSNAVRGSHAHKSLNQLIIAISGSFRVDLHDGTTSSQFLLSSPDSGLTVPPGYWRTLSDFSAGSAALVFASAEYDPEDYIRDFAEFQAWAKR